MIGASPEQTLVAWLSGPNGLTMDVFGQLLVGLGIEVAASDSPGGTGRHVDVVVLVDPAAEHWTAARACEAPIVLVTCNDPGDGGVVDSLLAGAETVLDCNDDPQIVLATIREVSNGGSVLRPIHARVIVGIARARSAELGVLLTKRETEILTSIAEGMAVKQTARDLGISPKTVENLQGRLFQKLGVRNRAQAVSRAHSLGLL
jgi:DNA-binding NarL/FixJ family response regulator